MLLELVTCAFAVFGTSPCDDGGNADAGEKFQELVLAYEKVLETKGDRKLRGLKDIHEQLDEIATRYPDSDVTAKILSSDIVGINLSRVERAIQKLDPDFNRQTETIVVDGVSSSNEVIEAPYNDLIAQIASVPHVPKNPPIEVKAAPQKNMLVLSTKKQFPMTLPTAKPRRHVPVVVADIPLPISKPEVQFKKQPVKKLASSLPKTADSSMLVMPTSYSGGFPFKQSSTWNNLGPQRTPAAIAPSPVILAQVKTDTLDNEKTDALDDKEVADSIVKNRYVEVLIGNASGDFSDLDFINPAGVGSTSNPTNGNNIILNNVDKSDSARTSTISTGGIYKEDIAFSLSLQTLNSLNAKGYATFGGTEFDQVIKSSGSVVSLGAGYHVASGNWFFEPKLELGIARIKSDGTQGAEVGSSGTFPSNTNTNLVPGVSATIGYNLSSKIDAIVNLGHKDIGTLKTGVTGNPPPSGMNTGEQLETNLSMTSMSIGLRYKF